jgi:peptide/nickel transport system permease protein
VSIAEIEARELALDAPTGGLSSEAWRRLRRNPGAIVGFIFLVAFAAAAIFAKVIAPEDPTNGDLARIGTTCCPGPSWAHPFGIDQVGRDVFSRVIYGARYSMIIGIVAVSLGLSLGMLFGSIAGYIGGVVDSAIMRLMDILLSIPSLLLAIGIVAALGQKLWVIMVAVGTANIPIFARLLRGSILAQRDHDFVLAARAVGVRRRSILLSHILPNAISPVIVQGTLALATAIIDVAGLSFLGLGNADPSLPEWGAMLNEAQDYLSGAPYLAIFPGVAIVVSALGFNLIGDGLREALDPKLRGRA